MTHPTDEELDALVFALDHLHPDDISSRDCSDAITALRAQLADVRAERDNANKIMDDWTTLHRVIADIRDASGLGSRPMLSELACEIGQRISAANDRAQLAEVQDFPDRKSMSKRIGEQRKLIRKLQILADGRLKRIEQLQDNVRQANDRADRAEAEKAARIEAAAGIVEAAYDSPAEYDAIDFATLIRNQPHDRSALDRMLAEASEQAQRKLAETIRGWRNAVPMTGDECANAILAMIPKEGA